MNTPATRRVATGTSPSRRASSRGFALALLLLLALAACSDDEPVASATSTPPESVGTAPASTAPSTPPPTTSTSTAATDAPTEPVSAGEGPLGPLVEPSEESTADRSVAPPAEVVTITSITATALDGAEQITITSTGGVPGWSVRYVDVVRIDGEPVITEPQDGAALEIVLQAADPTGEQGMSPEVSEPLHPDQPLLREVTLARYLGDMVVFAVGLTREVPFSVATTDTTITITFAG